MKWSWKLGSIAGITVQIHWTFAILIGWVVLVHVSLGAHLTQALGGVLLVLAVFSCVVLHEFGHALTARRFGIHTKDITLLPIGGMARLERMPDDPAQELLVAAAGPAVNLLIAGVLAAGLAALGHIRPVTTIVVGRGDILTQLMWVNVLLVLFNLLPAFPMDGGRILRAVLAFRLPHVRATRIAALVGQTMAILFGTVGLFVLRNPFLLFIAIFVYVGAQQEATQAVLRFSLRGTLVRDVMTRNFQVLSPHTRLEEAVPHILAGSQQDFPVADGNVLLGLLTRTDVVRERRNPGSDTTVGSVMRRDCATVDAADSVARAFERMREPTCSTLLVLSQGRLVGLLTLRDVGALVMTRAVTSSTAPKSAIEDIFGIPDTDDRSSLRRRDGQI